MAKIGKRLQKAYEGIDPTKTHRLDEAVQLIKERATAKFDETVEAAAKMIEGSARSIGLEVVG